MSFLLRTNFAQLRFTPIPPSSPPPPLLCFIQALTTPQGAHLKEFLSQKLFSLCLCKPQVISAPLCPVCFSILSLCCFLVVVYYRSTLHLSVLAANLQTGIVSSLAIRRGGLGAEMPTVWERKVRRSADTGVVLGCNKLASCQGNHLVESVV